MIYWAQLLHFYQPPTQSPSMLKKICSESYRPLLKVFTDFQYARATLNFNGVLTEMLSDCGHTDIIDGYRLLAEKGQIEFTGSAVYHAILPLLPLKEVERQIRLNTSMNRKLFGNIYQPKGFFPPEMCYSRDIVPQIADAGYKWIILSGIACNAEWPMDFIYRLDNDSDQLCVFFRDDVLSNQISFQNIDARGFITHLAQWKGKKENIYVVTAMDAETFGHHIQGWEKVFLAEVYDELESLIKTSNEIHQKRVLADTHENLLKTEDIQNQIKMVTISELIELFNNERPVEPRASSWSTTTEDLQAVNPYPLWFDKNNEIHKLQWEHLRICIKLVYASLKYADNAESKHYAAIARKLLDKAEHSCQMWWASQKPMWDINMIYMGLLDQLRTVVNAYRAINKSNADEAIKRENYYLTVIAADIRDKLNELLFVQ